MNYTLRAMITDRKALTEIRAAWKVVGELRDKIQRALLFTSSSGGMFPFSAADAAHNLPFVQACAVLNDALLQLKCEGHFKCKSIFLGALLEESKTKLPWTDYLLIKELVRRRNGIAHRAEILPRDDCWRYIKAIGTELAAWGIVPGP